MWRIDWSTASAMWEVTLVPVVVGVLDVGEGHRDPGLLHRRHLTERLRGRRAEAGDEAGVAGAVADNLRDDRVPLVVEVRPVRAELAPRRAVVIDVLDGAAMSSMLPFAAPAASWPEGVKAPGDEVISLASMAPNRALKPV
jgi:hypothetical protein